MGTEVGDSQTEAATESNARVLRPYDTRDEPGHNNDPAGAYGNHNCDAPTSLEESMYQSIESMVPDAALYLFTGDIPDHAVWNTTEATNKQKSIHSLPELGSAPTPRFSMS